MCSPKALWRCPQLSVPLAGSYVLTLVTDGMRSVRAFHFDKAAASVLTTSVSWDLGRVGPGLRPVPGPSLTARLPSDGHHGARVPVPRLSPGQLPPPQVHGEAAGAPSQCRPGSCRQGGCCGLWDTAPLYRGGSGPLTVPSCSQEEPPSKKKRVEATVGWSGEGQRPGLDGEGQAGL